MKYEVRDNLLFADGHQVEFRESPNVGREITPEIVVIHYTGDDSMDGAVSWLCAASSGVSAHLVIGQDGTIVQLVPFNVEAWHARGHYNGRAVNGFSVGIENVGTGTYWPDAQVEAIRAVVEALFKAYPIADVIGHVDIPDRTPGHDDPGPNFPWDKVTVPK